MEAGATVFCLPKSNQGREVGISQAEQAEAGPINRRAIPPAAQEGKWLAADGHAIRRIDWPRASGAGAARGSILFMAGRADGYEKYLECLEQWHRAGWRVTAADWRGQAGSGRLGNDPYTGHIDDFSTWVNDLAALWSDWKAATPGPHVLAGHSMGGHISLRTLAERKVDPAAAFFTAPMLGLYGQPLPYAAMHEVAKFMCKLGDPMRPAWKWSDDPHELPAGRTALLTHDAERYSDEGWWRRERPELIMGPGSWGWLERAYASMRSLYEPGVLEAVTVPVLILSALHDKLVSAKKTAECALRMPDCELIEFGEECYHEILREEDAVRDRAMASIAEFLDRVAPAG